MKKFFMTLFLILLSSFVIFSQSESIENDPEVKAALGYLETRLMRYVRDNDIPGLSVAVVYDQDLLWAKGFGYADLEKKIPADSKTIYRMASVTKPFTATMLMQLRDQGKLQLDDPLQKHLPEFKIKCRYKDCPSITLRQISSHTSGLPREAPLNHFVTFDFPTIEEILSSLTNTEMTFPPLTEWKYSNMGFALLGYTCSLIAGEPYREYVTEHILEPLGMELSGYILTEAMRRHMAVGYLPNRKGDAPKIAKHFDCRGMSPAGQLHSNVEDMSRFISLQFHQGLAGGNQILRGSTIREMHKLQWVLEKNWNWGYGIGWVVSRYKDYTLVGHSGDMLGFSTNIKFIPAKKVGIALLINTNSSVSLSKITYEALDIILPVVDRAAACLQPKVEAKPQEIWRKYVGIYYSEEGDAAIKMVKDQLMLAYPADVPEQALIPLAPEGKHTFRMKGGQIANGELLRFIIDERGNVSSMRIGVYPFYRD
jgi:CubicO group peptidase (beta-lactamase class C family)